MFYPSIGYGSDPNANRVIEELAFVLSDVEQRLQAVKIGLAQAFPHLAPNLGRTTPGLGMMGGFNPAIAAQMNPAFASGVPQGVPQGIPQASLAAFGLPPQFAGVTPFGATGPVGFPSFRY